MQLIPTSEVLKGDVICAPSDVEGQEPLTVLEVFPDCFKAEDWNGNIIKLTPPSDAQVQLKGRNGI